jgi:hemerythrin-like metal-binding protein
MSKPLYIVWQDDFDQGEGIIDEQHRGVIATINSLNHFLQQGHGLEVLMPTVKICLSYMNFHASTEETILKAADYPEIEEFIEANKQVVVDFKAVCREAMLNKEPVLVLQFLKRWWQAHLEQHQKTNEFLIAGSDHCNLSV